MPKSDLNSRELKQCLFEIFSGIKEYRIIVNIDLIIQVSIINPIKIISIVNYFVISAMRTFNKL
jgi:hypothetical protein